MLGSDGEYNQALAYIREVQAQRYRSPMEPWQRDNLDISYIERLSAVVLSAEAMQQWFGKDTIKQATFIFALGLARIMLNPKIEYKGPAGNIESATADRDNVQSLFMHATRSLFFTDHPIVTALRVVGRWDELWQAICDDEKSFIEQVRHDLKKYQHVVNRFISLTAQSPTAADLQQAHNHLQSYIQTVEEEVDGQRKDPSRNPEIIRIKNQLVALKEVGRIENEQLTAYNLALIDYLISQLDVRLEENRSAQQRNSTFSSSQGVSALSGVSTPSVSAPRCVPT